MLSGSWHRGRAALDGDQPGPGLERLDRAAVGELTLRVDEDVVARVHPRAEELQALPYSPFALQRERVREHRREDPADRVFVDRFGPRGNGQLPADAQRQAREDDPVVEVQVVVRGEQGWGIVRVEGVHA